MTQAEALVGDRELRTTIIANAREFVETEHNAEMEQQGYSTLATEMCKTPRIKFEDFAVDSSDSDGELPEQDKHRVRFWSDKKRQADASREKNGEDLAVDSASDPEFQETTEASEDARSGLQSETKKEPNREVRNETSLTEFGENAFQQISGKDASLSNRSEEVHSEPTSQILSASTADDHGKQPAASDGSRTDAASCVKWWRNPVTGTAASTPSPRSPRDGTNKVDAPRKRTTEASAKSNPPATAGKGGGSAAKNGPNQTSASESKVANKAATTASKKAPVNVDGGAKKNGLKPPAAIVRSASDPAACRATPSVADANGKTASRSQKTKK